MNISITGASGFVGHNLAKYLKDQGNTIEGVSLRDDWQFPMDTDAIIHLAGKAHDTSNNAEAEEYFKVNRDLTIQVFDQFLDSEVKDFFYFSSNSNHPLYFKSAWCFRNRKK